MNIKTYIKNFTVLLLSLIAVSGCMQWTYTGQNTIWKVNKPEPPVEKKCDDTQLNYDLVGIYRNSNNQEDKRSIKYESDVIGISLKTLYLKYIQDVYNFEVVVYAEVYDVVDETKILKRIAFHREKQPPTSYVNISGNLLYGPTQFNGYPILVKFYVLDLHKKGNEFFSELLNVASSVASVAQPQYKAAIQMASSVMQTIINLNPDVVEFSQEITFFPQQEYEKDFYTGASLLAPLETGDFVIVKKEDDARVVINRWWVFDKKAEDDAKKIFNKKDVWYDPYTGRLRYKKDVNDRKKDEEFTDKTYAVLTVFKPPQAVPTEMLAKISNAVQNTLNEILIKPEKLAQDQITAIHNMANYAEATIRIFNIKNLISGKESQNKKNILQEEYNKKIKSENTEATKIVKEEIERLYYKETGGKSSELQQPGPNKDTNTETENIPSSTETPK